MLNAVGEFQEYKCDEMQGGNRDIQNICQAFAKVLAAIMSACQTQMRFETLRLEVPIEKSPYQLECTALINVSKMRSKSEDATKKESRRPFRYPSIRTAAPLVH